MKTSIHAPLDVVFIRDEEALLFAKYLRNEKESWNPRIANL